jgi:hypothetical protein
MLKQMRSFLILLFIVLAAFSSAQCVLRMRHGASVASVIAAACRSVAFGYRDDSNFIWIFML